MTFKDELHQLVEKMNSKPEHIQNEKDRVFQVNLKESGSLLDCIKRWTGSSGGRNSPRTRSHLDSYRK